MFETWNTYDIETIEQLRRLVRSYQALADLAAGGDVASATMLSDIDAAMQHRPTDVARVISEKQYEAIQRLLIDDHSAKEVAAELGIHPRRVYYHVQCGLKHMLKFLQRKETSSWFGQPWQYRYLRTHMDMQTVAQMAKAIGKSHSATQKMLWNIRNKSNTSDRVAGRQPTRARSKAATGMAKRSVPNTHTTPTNLSTNDRV